MVSIAFRFLAGRYHATPWDHHVNEGAVEWPPSPWRILRALVAAAHRLDPAPDPARLRPLLLDRLGGLPSYRMPPAGHGHTRHYMPIARGQTTKVFDAFVAPGSGPDAPDGELVVTWPDAELSDDERRLLDGILAHLPYLGRAESWVEARRSADPGGPFDAVPLDGGASAEAVAHRAVLQALATEAEYAAWRTGFLAASPKAKRFVPANRWEALLIDTADLQARRWSAPPGARQVVYALRRAPFARTRTRVTAPDARPTVAWFELSGPVRPRIEEAVNVGDRARRALMSRSKGPDERPHPVFSGRDEEGRPLRSDHRHAFFLPTDDDGDGRIDHLVVWSREGFDAEARRALETFQVLWGPGGHALRVVLIGLAEQSALPGCPSVGWSHVWESRTPMVLPRHPKVRSDGSPKLDADGRWIEGPEWQLRRELQRLGLPEPQTVERLDAAPGPGRPLPWYRFRRTRLQGDGRRVNDRGYGFRLHFAEPVSGPIAVGYAAHQGLGRFVAIE